MPNSKVELPATVDAAVRLLQGLVPDAEQARIAYMKEDELVTLHLGLGMWIRNNLGLWVATRRCLRRLEKHILTTHLA